MPRLLRHSLAGQNSTHDDREDDERVEHSPTPPQSTQQPPGLRPLTTEARLESRTLRSSLSGFLSPQASDSVSSSSSSMPPIFPAPLSVSGAETQPKRRTFLPQLSHAKTFAMTQSPSQDHTPGQQEEDEDSNPQIVEEDTEAFKQAMWAGQANILVTVRVRPHCSHDQDEREIVKVLDHKLIVVLDKHQQLQQQQQQQASSPQHRVEPQPLPLSLPRRSSGITGSHGLRKLRNVASAHPARAATVAGNQTSTSQTQGSNRSREKRYAFDYVFTPQDSQQTVYHHTTKFLIHGVLNGFNATVFAYGCTGAGKTYTMLGTPDEPGIMALTLDDLFQNIAKVHADPQATVVYKVTVSFLEVYNENIRDLLVTPPPFGYQAVSPSSSSGSGGGATGLPGMVGTSEYLDLREDPVKGPVVAGISELEASNAHEVMKLLRRGNKHRSQEATAANAVSSRSHAVLQVLVEQREKPSSGESFGVDATRGGTMTSTVKYGKLSLVDLAGSERAAVTQNRGQRLIEGANINRSLLALGNCINALGEKGATGGAFVPYRDSKLTRLLKDSLGGNCRTVMIANVSPAAASVEETMNTLKYANRAKNIKTTVTRNVLNVDHHITEYAGVVAELKDEIVMLRKQLARQIESVQVPVAGGGTRASPGRSGGGRRAARKTTNNEDDREETDDDDGWKHAKLKEARGYISQSFEQRLQLRRRLVEIDHWIQQLTKRMAAAMDEGDQKSRLSSNEPEHGNAKEDASSKSSKPRDLATSILEDIVEDSQQREVAATSATTELDRVEAGLLARKTQLVAQLSRNQSIMDEFRQGIEQSDLFVSNEMLRDLLLTEYRLGDLQVDNAVLQAQQTLQNDELASLRERIAGGNTSESFSSSPKLFGDFIDVPSLDLPTSFTEMTRLLSANSTSSKNKDDDETPEAHSTRSSTGFAFLDDLRDRFYDRSKAQPHRQDGSAPVAKSSSTTAGRLSPRRQWGIHLQNTTLPYIRVKKKTPATLVTTSIVSGSSSASVASRAVDPLDPADPLRQSASAAAPYLKVLKHRNRKLHHRNSMSSSSHKKLPIVLTSSIS